MKEWFEGRSIVPQPINYRPWWLDVLLGLGCVAIVFAIIGGLSGCATSEDAKVCFMKPIGVTEEGYTVAAVQCMTPEAFAESQK
jgi:hypothetical protein